MWLPSIFVVFLLFLHQSGANPQDMNPSITHFAKDEPVLLRSETIPNPIWSRVNNSKRTIASKGLKKQRFSPWFNKIVESPSNEEYTSDENELLQGDRKSSENAIEYPSFSSEGSFPNKSRPPLNIRHVDALIKGDIEPNDKEHFKVVPKKSNGQNKLNVPRSDASQNVNGIKQPHSKERFHDQTFSNSRSSYIKDEEALTSKEFFASSENMGHLKMVPVNSQNEKLENMNSYNSSESLKNINIHFKSGDLHHHSFKKVKAGHIYFDSSERPKSNHKRKQVYFRKNRSHSHKKSSSMNQNNFYTKKKKRFHNYPLKKKYSYFNSSSEYWMLLTDNRTLHRLRKDFQRNLAGNSTMQTHSSKILYKKGKNNNKLKSHYKNLRHFKKGHFEKKSSSKKFKEKHDHKLLRKSKSSRKLKKQHHQHNPSLKKNPSNFVKRNFHKNSSPKSKTHKNQNKGSRTRKRKQLKEKIHGHGNKIQVFRQKSTKKFKLDETDEQKALQRKFSLLKSMNVIKKLLFPNAENENHLISRIATVGVVDNDSLLLPGGITILPPVQSKGTKISGLTSETATSVRGTSTETTPASSG